MNNQYDIDSLLKDFDGIDQLKETIHDSKYKSILAKLIISLETEIRNNGADPDTLLARISEHRPDETFWKHIRTSLNKRMEAYNDTAFIRNMTLGERRAFFQTTFQNMVLFQESAKYLKENLKLNDKQLEVVYKVYNTLIDWITMDRYSKRCFLERCYLVFAFDAEQSEELWNMLYENKQILYERMMSRFSKSLEEFLNRFDSFIESFESESSGDEGAN